eukprot:754582-Hanusia_phi.AAC.3
MTAVVTARPLTRRPGHPDYSTEVPGCEPEYRGGGPQNAREEGRGWYGSSVVFQVREAAQIRSHFLKGVFCPVQWSEIMGWGTCLKVTARPNREGVRVGPFLWGTRGWTGT